MEMSWITAISLMHSQDIDLFGNIIVKLINIKLFDLLTCCHYILNPLVYFRILTLDFSLIESLCSQVACGITVLFLTGSIDCHSDIGLRLKCAES